MANAIQSLWRDQEPELNRISIEEIRGRADLALSQDRKHKLVALLTASLVVACFVAFSVANSTLLGRIGGLVGISAGVLVVYRAYRLVRSYPLLPSAFGIEAYRRILEREQKGLAICWANHAADATRCCAGDHWGSSRWFKKVPDSARNGRTDSCGRTPYPRKSACLLPPLARTLAALKVSLCGGQ